MNYVNISAMSVSILKSAVTYISQNISCFYFHYQAG